ncbi:glycosyltransferase family 4 protein [Metabacillus sp. RGM 3146]|uniref:glycosyltransferase family 4 protein n=1 Tax=Metabacillus sp. RGM 3146 TaxID=3401092 RepID=UPI003B9AD53C
MKSHPQILMLTPEYPPNIQGGIGRHVQGLVPELTKLTAGLNIVTAPYKDSLQYEALDTGIRLHRPKLEGSFSSVVEWVLQLNLSYIHFVHSLKMDFDIIHVHDWLTAPAGMALKEYYGVPLAAAIHATEKGRKGILTGTAEKTIDTIERRLIQSADSIIVCSQYMQKELLYEYNGVQSTVIPNGRNLYFEENLFTEGFYLFAMGRMVKEKGFDTLLKSFQRVSRKLPQLQLVLAGDGPLKEEYEKLSESLGISGQVTFKGFLNDDDLKKMLKNAIISIVPSLYEPFGLAALESMSMKKATIVSDAGGLKELVKDQKSGLVFPAGNEEVLAEKIEQLISNDQLRKELAEEAYRKSLQYSWEHSAQKTRKLYDKLLSVT